MREKIFGAKWKRKYKRGNSDTWWMKKSGAREDIIEG